MLSIFNALWRAASPRTYLATQTSFDVYVQVCVAAAAESTGTFFRYFVLELTWSRLTTCEMHLKKLAISIVFMVTDGPRDVKCDWSLVLYGLFPLDI